ncbi:MAG: hypothetical protein M3Z85_12480 [Acidobacteriota bacterium]|nr:hypothetical protein [Acidobacteriota bacterium]
MLRNLLTVVYHTLLFGTFLTAWTSPAQPARDLALEYRKTEKGIYSAVLRNRHTAAATAYIAQASYRLQGKQQPTAFGGDSMAYPSGGYALPPDSSSETGNSLPSGAEPLTTGIMAAIYADGFTEGDPSVVQMLLSGRHRSLLDLPRAIELIDQAVSGKLDTASVLKEFEAMRSRDSAEAKQLDEMISVPGVRHGIFMTAVPSYALVAMQGARPPETLRAECRKWLETLLDSKPRVR